MEEKKIGAFTKTMNSSVTVLNAVLGGTAVLSIMLRLRGLGLVPFNDWLVFGVYAAVIVTLFVFAMITNEYTSKAKSVSSAMLPFSGALFGTWAWLFFLDTSCPGILLSLVAVILTIIISVRHNKKPVLGAVFKVLGGIIAVLTVLAAVLSALAQNLFYTQTIDRAVSPDGTYYAEAYLSDQGALGGNTGVTVMKAEKAIPTPLGWICETGEAVVYVGEWYDPEKNDGPGIRLSWEDENTLLINGNPEEIDDYFD